MSQKDADIVFEIADVGCFPAFPVFVPQIKKPAQEFPIKFGSQSIRPYRSFFAQGSQTGNILLVFPAIPFVIGIYITDVGSSISVYHRQNIKFYLVFFQEPDGAADPVISGKAAFGVPALVVCFLGSVQGYADEKFMVLEKFAPAFVKVKTVCLERVQDLYISAVILLFLCNYIFKKMQSA